MRGTNRGNTLRPGKFPHRVPSQASPVWPAKTLQRGPQLPDPERQPKPETRPTNYEPTSFPDPPQPSSTKKVTTATTSSAQYTCGAAPTTDQSRTAPQPRSITKEAPTCWPNTSRHTTPTTPPHHRVSHPTGPARQTSTPNPSHDNSPTTSAASSTPHHGPTPNNSHASRAYYATPTTNPTQRAEKVTQKGGPVLIAAILSHKRQRDRLDVSTGPHEAIGAAW